ncbi:hypothetical protein, unknown function [Leishmania braziliensis MHOM/BR/75/M2904]|uniref:Uncharacterized protein n=2 Tax=Leishmania braziliensis TaxID=5660 RepID=A4HJ69_LEIBR|nr:hypothetical protein, unknown function [Leishmania braziliensis MHOM/BR/75/M2904]KAI5687901.1 hypothetical protein MNV84_06253 [Leishmania braziliensis]CAJ2477868.1 unnamed protein product [Leishmania braziliensis]CAM42529.1 hypothetical protein, unknown function [Leishmania braziliensis MHOM/BR/75/M2904]SYZ68321.1 hypothetical_protein [Leishmania braziliensis MHOM/BR/75/M2904]
MSDASCHAPTYTGAKRAFHGDPPLVELAHPDRIAAAFRAMNSGDQRALQGESSTPVITPTSLELAGECRVVREKKMEMVKAVMPTAEMVENLTSCMSLENVSNNDLHEDPTVFLSGGLTSSKHSQTSGRGSLNVTTTRWTQRSERNTGSHSLTLPNSSESMKGSRDDSSGTAQTISSGDCGVSSCFAAPMNNRSLLQVAVARVPRWRRVPVEATKRQRPAAAMRQLRRIQAALLAKAMRATVITTVSVALAAP